MPGAKQVIALLSSHLEGNEERVYTIALQIAASEARQGHVKTADQLKQLVDGARTRVKARPTGPRLAVATPLVRQRADLEELVTTTHSDVHLSDMTLKESIRTRLTKLINQQQQRTRLREYGQRPSSRLLLVGPPGSGKTLTASALAGELHLPLFTVRLEGVLTRFMGRPRPNCVRYLTRSRSSAVSTCSMSSMPSAANATRGMMWARSAAY
jgi:SpoVK/Ycf46/Vps4 family AAA+-type ATPase